MQKTQLVNFLQNGSNFYPFGDKPNNSYSPEGKFKPFICERNQVGKLVNNESYNFSSIRKNTKQKTSEYNHIRLNLLQINQIEADTIIRQKFRTELESPKYDPNTKYVTLIPAGLNGEDFQKPIDIKSYTLNHNQVERGQLMKKQQKGLNHKHQLISRSIVQKQLQIIIIQNLFNIFELAYANIHIYQVQKLVFVSIKVKNQFYKTILVVQDLKNNQLIFQENQKNNTKTLTSQIPAIGIYDPLPLNKHLPNIQIKSKSIQKLPEVWERNNSVATPKQGLKHCESEMMFAKQIAQINREVEQQMKRNPNQKFAVQQFDINENMNLEEAEQMRNRMKQYFQSVKDSLTKIKNLINVKR